MSHSWSRIPVVLIAALACGGCASPLVEPKSPIQIAPLISSSAEENPSIPQRGAQSKTESLAFKTSQHNQLPPRPNPAAISATPIQMEKAEVDLAALDRALNSPESGLPPQYQAYLREQLNAIAGRSATGRNAGRLSGTVERPAIARGSPATAQETGLAANRPVADDRSRVAPSVVRPGSIAPLQVADNPVATTLSGERVTPAVPVDPPSDPARQSIAASAPAVTSVGETAVPRSLDPATGSPASDKVIAASATTAASTEEVRRGEWREHLTRTLDSLERELARYNPGDREGEQMATSARLLHLIANHRDQAVAAMDKLSEDEREYWKHQLHALLVAFDAEDKHAGSRRAALALRELREAADHLANLSTLDVRNLAFCERVESFGVYTPVKSTAFKPGQQVWLYVELDNFAVREAGEKFETQLQAEYNIVDASGSRISKKLPLVEEQCRNRRHDYCISYTLDVPKDLRPGDYTLQLTVEDVIGQKSSQASIEFRVR